MPRAFKVVNYWHIVVRPSSAFIRDINGMYRTHDIGRVKRSFRIAGKLRRTGQWATHSFHLHVNEVRRVNGRLVGSVAPTKRTLMYIRRRYGLIRVAM